MVYIIFPYSNHVWLVVLTILKNMKVNGKDDIRYIMENKTHVPHHQPDVYHIQIHICLPYSNHVYHIQIQTWFIQSGRHGLHNPIILPNLPYSILGVSWVYMNPFSLICKKNLETMVTSRRFILISDHLGSVQYYGDGINISSYGDLFGVYDELCAIFCVLIVLGNTYFYIYLYLIINI